MPYDLGTPFNAGRTARRGVGRPGAAPIRQRRNPREPDLPPADERADLSGHHRLRRNSGAADRQCRPVAPQLHPARAARAGQEPHPSRADRSARPVDPGRPRLRDSRRSARAARVRRAARGVASEGDALPIAWLPREARFVEKLATPGRDDRRHDRRPRSDQGGPCRAAAVR